MKGALLLDVVVGERAAILELLPSEDKTLLVRGNALLVLNLLLHVVDGVAALNLEGDGLAGKSLNENLHDYGCCCYCCVGLIGVNKIIK